ncbi:MAG: ABC transporter ATP-binding protein [Verrucomicrobiales bacterium]
MSAGTPIIQAVAITKSFGDHKALDTVSLHIKKGEFFSLLGPSGCGKTTLLKVLAGLENPDSGELLMGGRSMAKVPPHQRNVHTVFQSYALFPHLDVFNNIGFGLKMKKLPGAEIRSRVEKMLELFEISTLRHRKPDALSGGQKQRVALARAVVNEPELLLLDEPMAALDAQLRRQLQRELRALQRRLGMTFVYVTHDQEEALTMSDRMAVMNKGRVEQAGSPAEVYEYPKSCFVASFLGASNILKLEQGATAEGEMISTTAGEFKVLAGNRSPYATHIGIRPERIALLPVEATHSDNLPVATVLEATYTGAERHYLLDLNGSILRAQRPSADYSFQPGQKTKLHINPEDIRFLES